jgi:hypothetical protein
VSEQIRVYRGIQRHKPSGADGSKVGMHWTEDPHVAMQFARYGGLVTRATGSGSAGYVLEGLVDPTHVLSGASKADRDVLERNKVLSGGEEKEVSIRPGAPITVVGHHRVVSAAQLGRTMDGTGVEHRPVAPYTAKA